MNKISLTTNIDLQNYQGRIEKISQIMNPLGIEIMTIPQNYLNKFQHHLPEKEKLTNGFKILNKETARDIGQRLKKCKIKKIQYHYPWQKTILDLNGQEMVLTIEFCDILLSESKAEQLTINYHNLLQYPMLPDVSSFDGKYRQKIHKMLETKNKLLAEVRNHLKSKCLLSVENNPTASKGNDLINGNAVFDQLDLVPEDYIHREGIDATTLDYPHAWTVVKYFQQKTPLTSLEWCRRQYQGIPQSVQSLENFIKTISPKLKWVHLADETNPLLHTGLHIGEGKVDFVQSARLLEKYLPEPIPATIETKEGHTKQGFRKIVENDWPKLNHYFNLDQK